MLGRWTKHQIFNSDLPPDNEHLRIAHRDRSVERPRLISIVHNPPLYSTDRADFLAQPDRRGERLDLDSSALGERDKIAGLSLGK